MPSQAREPVKWAERYCGPQSWRSCQAAGDVGVQPAPAVDDGVIDRLEGGEAVADLGHMRPGLGGVVVHAGKHPHPAVDPGPGHGGVGAPAQVGTLGDDRAVMGPWLAPATDPLGRQQPLPARSSRSTRLPLTWTPCSRRSRARILR